MSINDKIKEMVMGDKVVRFSRYQQNHLYYVTENGFEFPVPMSDTGDAAFKAEDKALFFMRWIRIHLTSIEENKVTG